MATYHLLGACVFRPRVQEESVGNWEPNNYVKYVAYKKIKNALAVSQLILLRETFVRSPIKHVNNNNLYWLKWNKISGDVAQMVERSLSMWEVRGSIPRISK